MYSENSMPLNQETIIQCKDLGKCYQIYDTPKDRLKQAIWRGRRQYYREFWALRNLSFEVKRGESLGIIGRNGSGKSTLLQLICGTLTPTEGEIQTKGRIAALLELGSGFNPEFTGIENVYLNASMMGLSKEETDNRIEDIFAFADIGNFVDQPTKTYSSGMVVRLAFAVVAHVDADILVVDEALAVGDMIFVQRCMRFIRRIREERCLLFVSHDAEAVKSLCSNALWISKGIAQVQGNCTEVSLAYLRYCQATSYGEEFTLTATGNSAEKQHKPAEALEKLATQAKQIQDKNHFDYESEAHITNNMEDANGWKTGDADLIEISIKARNASVDNSILKGGEEVEIIIRAKAHKSLNAPALGFVLKNKLGQALFGENTLITRDVNPQISARPGDELNASFKLIFPMLPSGQYALMASIADGDLNNNTQHHWLEDAVVVSVVTSRVQYGLIGAFITDVSFNLDSR